MHAVSRVWALPAPPQNARRPRRCACPVFPDGARRLAVRTHHHEPHSEAQNFLEVLCRFPFFRYP